MPSRPRARNVLCRAGPGRGTCFAGQSQGAERALPGRPERALPSSLPTASTLEISSWRTAGRPRERNVPYRAGPGRDRALHRRSISLGRTPGMGRHFGESQAENGARRSAEGPGGDRQRVYCPQRRWSQWSQLRGRPQACEQHRRSDRQRQRIRCCLGSASGTPASSIGDPIGKARGSGVVFVPKVEAGLLKCNQRRQGLRFETRRQRPPCLGKPCLGRPLLGDASAASSRRWTPFSRKVADLESPQGGKCFPPARTCSSSGRETRGVS